MTTTRIFVRKLRAGMTREQGFNRFDEAETVTNGLASGRNAKEAAERHDLQTGDVLFTLGEHANGGILRMYRVTREGLSVEQVTS